MYQAIDHCVRNSTSRPAFGGTAGVNILYKNKAMHGLCTVGEHAEDFVDDVTYKHTHSH